MSIVRMPIGQFVAELKAAEARHDGYIMGAKGQNPKSWKISSGRFTQYLEEPYTREQYEKAIYWREHAERVWDCNGLAEGIYEDYTGVNINSKARYNYSEWCGVKGEGEVPAAYRVPGCAVFIHSEKSGYITHVGYLVEPIEPGNQEGDWWVIEARGVMYGVVKTRLTKRGWNRWGLMDKYFDYGDIDLTVDATPHLGDRLLKGGCEGEDVRELQTALIRLGYDCGRWGADGDFGDATEQAVMAYQRAEGLSVDGICGPKTAEALAASLARLDQVVEEPHGVRIVGGNCWVRSAPNVSGQRLGVAHEGDRLIYEGKTSEDGWHKIAHGAGSGWVSGKYSRLEG